MGNGYDIIIIGGGHAGAEAAAASAKRGAKVLLLSLSLDALGFMPCNPNVGGSAKGHLVTEIEALGGIMGKAADKASLQVKVLNKVNGAAVHSLRMQTDKNLYHRTIKSVLENTENLTILQTEAVEILVKEESGVKIVCGVKTRHGAIYSCRAAVICCGVYLNSRTLTGETIVESGPNGFLRSEILTKSLLSLGLPLRRFKTGTPPRLKGNSIDYTKCEIQTGDADESGYSYECPPRNDVPCYLTYTNSDTHNIILSNLDRAPLYNGSIAGVGPRYCPSIEDKVVRFKDKARHQLFIEPEGADTDEVYLSGFSTSLPSDIQNECVKTIAGLENAHITRYGYAIEYDCLDPRALYPSLAVKG
ncbi:MAG: tRNA uridine-5-carboxymethylaminomethyl(34) synthesis enzyme MnmG, partial [Christensenellaceae bacterium]|nr:tRNA uridine-5-carboxymethylaminomethyl(34) synthesis enzyme MnmG [Christensenellaceae bacterium]